MLQQYWEFGNQSKRLLEKFLYSEKREFSTDTRHYNSYPQPRQAWVQKALSLNINGYFCAHCELENNAKLLKKQQQSNVTK